MELTLHTGKVVDITLDEAIGNEVDINVNGDLAFSFAQDGTIQKYTLAPQNRTLGFKLNKRFRIKTQAEVV